MLVVITSDSHGGASILKEIVLKHPDADAYLDAGDSEKHDFELKPFISVRGNCDIYIKERRRIIQVGTERIYMFHGDNFLLTNEALSLKAVQNGCGIIIHGHTHIPKYEIYKGIHIICPGSPVYPRFGYPATYAVLTKNKHIVVRFIKVMHEKS